MDEKNYHVTRSEIIPVLCVFEKSILASRLSCTHSAKRNIADREVIQCASAAYQVHCVDWLQLLRKKSQFALRLSGPNESSTALPHGKEMKIQVGGITGVASYLARQNTDDFDEYSVKELDVYHVLKSCRVRHCRYEELPYEEIVQSVSRCRARQN